MIVQNCTLLKCSHQMLLADIVGEVILGMEIMNDYRFVVQAKVDWTQSCLLYTSRCV